MQNMSSNTGPEDNQSGMSNMIPNNPQMTSISPAVQQPMSTSVTYPEIYFKLQPYLSMVRTSLSSMGRSPTQEELDQISDSIYDDMCKRDPDLKEYLNKYDPPADDPPPRGRGGMGPRFGFGIRRRGLGRDFIDALLLAQLFGRPCPYPYPYCQYPYY